jgi:hypothetical protein
MDKLSDIRQVKLMTVEAASRIIAANPSLVASSATGSEARLKAAALATKKLAVELEKYIWSSEQVR